MQPMTFSNTVRGHKEADRTLELTRLSTSLRSPAGNIRAQDPGLFHHLSRDGAADLYRLLDRGLAMTGKLEVELSGRFAIKQDGAAFRRSDFENQIENCQSAIRSRSRMVCTTPADFQQCIQVSGQAGSRRQLARSMRRAEDRVRPVDEVGQWHGSYRRRTRPVPESARPCRLLRSRTKIRIANRYLVAMLQSGFL